MKLKWQDKFVFHLINKIHGAEFVWNHTIPAFKLKFRKQQFFLELVDEMNTMFKANVPFEYEEITNKWCNLKSYFATEKQRIEKANRSGAGVHESSSWKFFDSLKFLMVVNQQTQSVNNFQKKSLEAKGIILPIILTLLYTFSWTTTTSVNAAKILGLFAHPSESHFAVMQSLVLELAKREHNVTVYSSHRLNERVDNIKEIIIEPEFPFWKRLIDVTYSQAGGLLKLSQLTESSMQKSLGTVGSAAVDYFLSNAAMQKLLNLPINEFDYDLVIVDLFYTEALLAVGHFYKKPTIGIVSTNFENYMEHVLEQIVPVACSPNDYVHYVPEMGYWQRLGTIRSCLSRRKQFAKSNWGGQEQLIRKHFAHFEGASGLNIATLQAELAVLLLNSHVPLITPRPMLANTIAAGGMHIRPPRELPWPIRRFLDESRTGVIYINLGNEQLCADIPKPTFQLLIQTLGKMKERVLWTCHDYTELKDLPTNIMVQHATTQTDILAHPHVRTFLMNGDLLSLQEGIIRHVPMLGLPIFRNEMQNMALAVQLGVGIQINQDNLTATSLKWALQTLKEDSTYALAIRRVSTAFRDRPLGGLETCIYWMDYVLRHQGGAQLKTVGVGIPSSHLHLFDLFIYYFTVALLIVGVLALGFYSAIVVLRKREIEKMYTKLS